MQSDFPRRSALTPNRLQADQEPNPLDHGDRPPERASSPTPTVGDERVQSGKEVADLPRSIGQLLLVPKPDLSTTYPDETRGWPAESHWGTIITWGNPINGPVARFRSMDSVNSGNSPATCFHLTPRFMRSASSATDIARVSKRECPLLPLDPCVLHLRQSVPSPGTPVSWALMNRRRVT